MDSGYILYGAPGSGSVAVEAALELLGVDYRRADLGRPLRPRRFRRLGPGEPDAAAAGACPAVRAN